MFTTSDQIVKNFERFRFYFVYKILLGQWRFISWQKTQTFGSETKDFVTHGTVESISFLFMRVLLVS